MTNKTLQDMTVEELSKAKRALDEEFQQVRRLKGLATSAEAKAEIDRQLTEIRAKKLAIQAEQDKRPAPPVNPDAPVYSIGVSTGIVSGEKVGNIGGTPPAKIKTKK